MSAVVNEAISDAAMLGLEFFDDNAEDPKVRAIAAALRPILHDHDVFDVIRVLADAVSAASDVIPEMGAPAEVASVPEMIRLTNELGHVLHLFGRGRS